jgi:hypothetical protein
VQGRLADRYCFRYASSNDKKISYHHRHSGNNEGEGN